MKSKNKYLRFKRVVDGWIPFSAILVIFAISAGLIAVNSAFPLPYDERYHFALIEHYSHQLSPIITAQPAELAIVGDATRLGSYLSHYLLSSPLRFTAMFTSDVQLQITALRLINVGFVLAALVLLRIFVARLTKSGVAANLAVAVLALLPVTSLLAAHINYDNLMLLVFAGLLVSGQSIAMRIKTGGQLPVSLVSIFTATALLGCLVKFTFLPIAVVFLAVFGVSFIRAKAWRQVTVKRTAISRVVAVGSLILVAVSAGLFAERYIGNTLAYGTPQPDCDAVQQISVCSQYGPWARNYTLEQSAAQDGAFRGLSAEGYTAKVWAPLMIRGLGGVNDQGIVAGVPKPMLTALIVAALVLTAGAIGAAVMHRGSSLVFMTVSAIALYMLLLWQRNYSEYTTLHEVVAVQGRYMLPFVVPMLAIGLIGIKLYVDQLKKAPRRLAAFARHVRTIHPDEAYEFSKNYWAQRIASRRLTDS